MTKKKAKKASPKKANDSNFYGIYLGVPEGTVREIHVAINDILKSGADQATMQEALNVLRDAAKIEECTISNCSINLSNK